MYGVQMTSIGVPLVRTVRNRNGFNSDARTQRFAAQQLKFEGSLNSRCMRYVTRHGDPHSHIRTPGRTSL